MKSFIVYNSTTGEIVSLLNTSNISYTGIPEEEIMQQTILPQVGEGESLLEVPADIPDISLNYLDLTNMSLVQIPPSPGKGYLFNYVSKTWEPNIDMLSNIIMARRDELLGVTDWIIVRSMDTGEPVPDNVKSYRQALRNITQQAGYPTNVVWPSLAE
jgi:hypothetical protein